MFVCWDILTVVVFRVLEFWCMWGPLHGGHHTLTLQLLTLHSKVVSICEVFLGKSRPLLSDLANFSDSIG